MNQALLERLRPFPDGDRPQALSVFRNHFPQDQNRAAEFFASLALELAALFWKRLESAFLDMLSSDSITLRLAQFALRSRCSCRCHR